MAHCRARRSSKTTSSRSPTTRALQVRRIHMLLRVAPALAAALSKAPLSMKDVVAMMEARKARSAEQQDGKVKLKVFGKVAIEATHRLRSAKASDPREAWRSAAQALGCSPSMAAKGCPRGAYLGLCEEGLVRGVPIPTKHLTKSIDNKRYAMRAIEALRRDATLLCRPADLWQEVSSPRTIAHNGQIDVVLGLWAEELISN